VIQSYRHRFGYAPGDPALDEVERRLAPQPRIEVPAINLHGGADGVMPAALSEDQARRFGGRYARRVLPDIGHNVPQEAPDAVVAALERLRAS
jgi:pimeloyl-ACP methyl ester carboxylesterase